MSRFITWIQVLRLRWKISQGDERKRKSDAREEEFAGMIRQAEKLQIDGLEEEIKIVWGRK